MPVVVVGPLAFDNVRTPAGDREGILGGSGAYASIAAAKHGPTALVSVAGEDLADADVAPLVAAGVDLSGLERRPGRTLRWSGVYDGSFTKSDVRNTDLGAVAGWRPRIPRPWAASAYVVLANTDPRAQAAALGQLRPAVAVLDTMAEWIVGHRRALDEVLAGVGVISVNEDELALLGGAELERAVAVVRARGPRVIVVKRGGRGVALCTAAGVVSVPAHPATVVDPTGAGDAFAGAFTARLAALGRADDAALRDALAHGAAAASFAIESFGVDALVRATRADVDARASWLAARMGTGQAAPLYEGR